MGIILLLWVLSWFVNMVIAENKNRSGVAWFFISVFTGFLSTLILIVLPAAGRRQCPHCAEWITKIDAKICRYCGRDLPKVKP